MLQADQGLVSSGGRAISPKAPMSAVPDRSEIGPYLRGGSSQERGVLLKADQGLVSSGGRAISPKAPTSAVQDRSEIGPYLGGLRTTFRGAHPPVRDAAIETVPAKRPFPLWGMLQGDRDPDSRRTSTAQSGRAVEGSRSV